jgi:hypothetical protein
MSDEELEELAEQKDISNSMLASCDDYACYCHAKVPILVAEIRRLRALLKAAGMEDR